MLLTPLALVAALTTTAPAPQTAYVQTPPVNVASCSLDRPVPQDYFGFSLPANGSLAISFSNQNEKVATSVTFAVTDGRTTQNIVDDGTFSNGAQIDHDFATPAFANGSNVRCLVNAVAFSDGSTWQAQ